MIQIEDLTVDLGGFVLGPLSFTVRAGERVALVGANGAGKTTTFRAINGLLLNGVRGTVRVMGREVVEAGPELRERVGYLPEHIGGFGWMTVAEHLEFLSSFYPAWDSRRAEELRKRLDLPAGTKLANLSKGMQLKLGLVAAESHAPPILLLDEPTSGIDPVMREEILSLLIEHTRPEAGRAVVFSSHILEDVELVADRVLLLREGRLLGDLSVAELRTLRPAVPVSQQLVERLRTA